MSTMDALKAEYGKGTVHLASSGIEVRTRQRGMRQERLTPSYTTAWTDIPIASAV